MVVGLVMMHMAQEDVDPADWLLAEKLGVAEWATRRAGCVLQWAGLHRTAL